jgi:isopenicillin N synthase-like dioxygenase
MFEALSVQRLKMSRQQHLSNTLRLPPDLQTVSEGISSLFTYNDTVLRTVAQKLNTNASPPLEAVNYSDPTNPGDSNMCLGIASARAGMEILGDHLDEDILTITYYDEPFLEVQDRKTGEWGLVDVNEHMPIVNVGDELQKASKGRFYAPPHRVVQSPKEINLVMYDLNEGVSVA